MNRQIMMFHLFACWCFYNLGGGISLNLRPQLNFLAYFIIIPCFIAKNGKIIWQNKNKLGILTGFGRFSIIKKTSLSLDVDELSVHHFIWGKTLSGDTGGWVWRFVLFGIQNTNKSDDDNLYFCLLNNNFSFTTFYWLIKNK